MTPIFTAPEQIVQVASFLWNNAPFHIVDVRGWRASPALAFVIHAQSYNAGPPFAVGCAGPRLYIAVSQVEAEAENKPLTAVFEELYQGLQEEVLRAQVEAADNEAFQPAAISTNDDTDAYPIPY